MRGGGGGGGGLSGFVDDLKDGVDEGVDLEDVVEPETEGVVLGSVPEFDVDAEFEREGLRTRRGEGDVSSEERKRNEEKERDPTRSRTHRKHRLQRAHRPFDRPEPIRSTRLLIQHPPLILQRLLLTRRQRLKLLRRHVAHSQLEPSYRQRPFGEHHRYQILRHLNDDVDVLSRERGRRDESVLGVGSVGERGRRRSDGSGEERGRGSDREGTMRLELTTVILGETREGGDGGGLPVGFDASSDFELDADEGSDDREFEGDLGEEDERFRVSFASSD